MRRCESAKWNSKLPSPLAGEGLGERGRWILRRRFALRRITAFFFVTFVFFVVKSFSDP